MQHRLALWVSAVSCAAALSSACGSSSSLGSQLAPSGVTVTSLAISVVTPSVGGGAQATATATFSNGSTSPVASGFGGDSPSVATVTSAGVVTGVAIGDVTIFVDYQGMRASKKVHVLPSYSGISVGTYMVDTCAATGGFVTTDPATNFCTEFTADRMLQIAMQNTQSADLTTVTGAFLLGGLQGTGSGTVSPTGTLTYSGAVILGSERMDFRNWTATSPSPGRMVGSFEMVFTDTAMAGQGVVTCKNMDMTRQVSALAFSSAPASVRVARLAPWAESLLRDLRIR
jgi:hypothetical protein